MIDNDRFENISQKAIECQNFDMPCVLLYLERNAEGADRLSWIGACNSAYELIGMVDRAGKTINSVVVTNREDEEE